MIQLIKDVRDKMMLQSWKIGPIDGISSIQLNQPIQLTDEYEQIIIS